MGAVDESSCNPSPLNLLSTTYTEDEANTIVSNLQKFKIVSKDQSEEIGNKKNERLITRSRAVQKKRF